MQKESDHAIINLKQRADHQHTQEQAKKPPQQKPQEQRQAQTQQKQVKITVKPEQEAVIKNDILAEWEAPEHIWWEKSKQWYAAFTLLVGAVSAAFILLKNLSALMVVAVGAVVALIAANTKPKNKKYSIVKNGVIVHGRMYEFIYLKSFWIHEPLPGHRELVIHSKKSLGIDLKIPLGNQDAEKIKNMLSQYVEMEQEPEEKLADVISRIVGI